MKDESSYIEYVQTSEVTVNLEFREELVSATGFCNRHMYLLYRYAFSGRGENGLGYATYAKDVISKLEKKLDSVRTDLRVAIRRTRRKNIFARGKAWTAAIQASVVELEKTVRGSSICPLCDMLLGADQRTISTFLGMLEDQGFASLFAKSNGICLPHYVSAMESLLDSRSKSEAVAGQLMQVELENLRRIDHLLGERMRKYSWDFRDEKITEDESSSQEMALTVISGAEGLYSRSRKVGLHSALEKR